MAMKQNVRMSYSRSISPLSSLQDDRTLSTGCRRATNCVLACCRYPATYLRCVAINRQDGDVEQVKMTR